MPEKKESSFAEAFFLIFFLLISIGPKSFKNIKELDLLIFITTLCQLFCTCLTDLIPQF